MRYHTYTNNKDLVVVTSTYAGKVVRGVAKCSPNDEFRLETGEALAKARCDEKVAWLRRQRALGKYREVMNEINKLEKHLSKMERYFDDSDEEYFVAHLDRINLEGKLLK